MEKDESEKLCVLLETQRDVERGESMVRRSVHDIAILPTSVQWGANSGIQFRLISDLKLPVGCCRSWHAG
jgi:hypothetical protein